jgi:hypothetical protein
MIKNPKPRRGDMIIENQNKHTSTTPKGWHYYGILAYVQIPKPRRGDINIDSPDNLSSSRSRFLLGEIMETLIHHAGVLAIILNYNYKRA